jgi:hypothetical protein
MSKNDEVSEPTERDQNPFGGPATPEGQEIASEVPRNGPEDHSASPQTFSGEYVRQLREENARYRVKSKRAEDLARSLATEYARATGRLVDPSDLPFSDDLLNEYGNPDPQKVREGVEALIASKPHLARLRVSGDVGQGVGQTDTEPGLASMLRAGAG